MLVGLSVKITLRRRSESDHGDLRFVLDTLALLVVVAPSAAMHYLSYSEVVLLHRSTPKSFTNVFHYSDCTLVAI
jgi:hypothetical protein